MLTRKRQQPMAENRQLPARVFYVPAQHRNHIEQKKLTLASTSLVLAQAIDVGMTESLKGLQVEIEGVVAASKRPGPYKQ